VPEDTVFQVQLSDELQVQAVCRWCNEDRMGLAFDVALPVDSSGAVTFVPPRTKREQAPLRKAG
jgi:hypothetical protein